MANFAPGAVNDPNHNDLTGQPTNAMQMMLRRKRPPGALQTMEDSFSGNQPNWSDPNFDDMSGGYPSTGRTVDVTPDPLRRPKVNNFQVPQVGGGGGGGGDGGASMMNMMGGGGVPPPTMSANQFHQGMSEGAYAGLPSMGAMAGEIMRDRATARPFRIAELGQEEYTRELNNRMLNMNNWMKAQNIRGAQNEEGFYNSPDAAQFFHQAYPGLPGTPKFGQGPMYDSAMKNRLEGGHLDVNRAAALQVGSMTPWSGETDETGPSPEHAAWRKLLLPPTTPPAAPLNQPGMTMPHNTINEGAFDTTRNPVATDYPTEHGIQSELDADTSLTPQQVDKAGGPLRTFAGHAMPGLVSGPVSMIPYAGIPASIASMTAMKRGYNTPYDAEVNPKAALAGEAVGAIGALGPRALQYAGGKIAGGWRGLTGRMTGAGRTPPPVGANPARPSMSNVPGGPTTPAAAPPPRPAFQAPATGWPKGTGSWSASPTGTPSPVSPRGTIPRAMPGTGPGGPSAIMPPTSYAEALARIVRNGYTPDQVAQMSPQELIQLASTLR